MFLGWDWCVLVFLSFRTIEIKIADLSLLGYSVFLGHNHGHSIIIYFFCKITLEKVIQYKEDMEGFAKQNSYYIVSEENNKQNISLYGTILVTLTFTIQA